MIGTEWKVIACMIAVLALAEMAMRNIETRLSKDIEHIRSLPASAQAMREHHGYNVLLLGNSLTRCGIDTSVLREELARLGKPDPRVFACHPDATNVTHWDFALHRYFLDQNARPDLVIIGTASHHLADSTPDPLRLGAFYVGDGPELSRAWRQDLPTFADRCEFLLSRYSVLYASRGRVKPLLFWKTVPHYFEMEQEINAVRQGKAGRAVSSAQTYHHLRHLAESLKTARIPTVIAAIPIPEHYAMPSGALEALSPAGAGVRMLDLQSMFRPPARRFTDGYHLDDEGARQLTHLLAKQIAASPPAFP